MLTVHERKLPCVDRQSRDKAAKLLRRFASGQITNDEFEDSMPETGDPAIHAIWDTAWYYYNDIKRHKLVNVYRLHPDTRRMWVRWVLFLDSNHPYLWPDIGNPGNDPTAGAEDGLINLLKRLVVRSSGDQSKAEIFESAGYYPVWPFISTKDYREVLRRPKRLAGRRFNDSN
jgi:hypothetical protein